MLRLVTQHRLAHRLHAQEEHVRAETGVQLAGLLVAGFLASAVEEGRLDQASLGPLQPLVAPLGDDDAFHGGVHRAAVAGLFEDQGATVLLNAALLLGARLEQRVGKRDAAQRGLEISRAFHGL